MARVREGEMGAFAGSSRTGKTAACKQHIKGHERVLVRSPKERIDRYQDTWPSGTVSVVRTRKGLVKAIEKYARKPRRIIYDTQAPESASDFAFFCRCAWWWGMQGERAGVHTSIVVDELGQVTHPGKAPREWHRICSQGLGYGLNVYGLSQRPAEADKTCIGNATFVHCCKLTRKSDRKYMADELDCDPGELAGLEPLHYVQRWQGRAELVRGMLVFT